MEQSRPTSTYHQALERLQDGLTVEICNDFDGESLVLELGKLAEKYEVNTCGLHRETIRALCHYASVAAGELTDTAILFTPNVTLLRGTGYAAKSAIVHQFIVRPRAEPHIFKRGVTYEPRRAAS